MSEASKLVSYVIVVGPSTNLPEEAVSPTIPELDPSSPMVEPLADEWDSIFKPGPAILRRFPETNDPACPLANNIVYFCQPEGCIKERKEEASHIFMLTNTETNVRTYGVCISLPHLIDPLARAQSSNWEYENQDSVSIQEWGLLTVCILSQHQCFQFFKKCLRTLIHFMETYCGPKLSWDLLIHSKFASNEDPNYACIRELERWIDKLLELPVPKDGTEVLEVELEVDPACMIGFPPSSRLPLFDLGVHELFEILDVHLVLEIFQLLLLEQKVILHSEDQGVASQCILTMVALLYPLQYLFPIIPLLPTCLPNVENLLLVPTPYFVGVCTSFLQKVCSFHSAEAWIIDLDKKSVTEPKMYKIKRPEFPLSLQNLQADIRRSLDLFNKRGGSSNCSNVSLPTCQDGVSLEDEIDTQIRLSFAEFLLGDEMLGLVENHLSIYRLFPRPVVALKLSAFLRSYRGNTEFMQMFIKSQSVEYFLEWSLNPSNKAFEEIKKGFCNPHHISDRIQWWISRIRPTQLQYTLYEPDHTSLLYQEMLNHKAKTAVRQTLSVSDDSDFEFVGSEYCNRPNSDMASSSCLSNTDSSPFSHHAELSSNAIPVTIEFHPATPTSVDLDVPSTGEIFLSLHEKMDKSLGSHSPEPHVLDPIASERTSLDSVSINLPDEIDNAHAPTKNQLVVGSSDTPSSEPISSRNVNTLTEPDMPKRVLTPDSSILGLPVDPLHNITMWMGIGGDKGRSPTPEQHAGIPKSSSWMNLTGGSIELLQFTKPPVTVERADGTNRGGVSPTAIPAVQVDRLIRSVPWSAVSSLHELELQIKEIVGRIGEGNGLPWYKSPAVKSIFSDERSRIALLRVLEVRLEMRKQTVTKLSADGQIKPVVLSRSVYKGVLELLKNLLQYIEVELTKDPDQPVFSLFLILRLALCLCTRSPRKRTQSTRIFPREDKENLQMTSKGTQRKMSMHIVEREQKRPESPLSSPMAVQPSRLESSFNVDDTVVIESVDGEVEKKKGEQIELQELVGDHSPKTMSVLAKKSCKKVLLSTPPDIEETDTPLMYLHNDLIRELGSNFKELVVKRHFWNNVFISVVHTDRKYLGWNEKTSELYDRYNTLPSDKKSEFAYEEDSLLSIVLHNMLLFILIMGVDPKDAIDQCHRLSAKTRLASIEERLLQQTLKEINNTKRNSHTDIKNLTVLSLYSETHSVVTFVIHHGISVTAPIFKLQITDDVCILRRFPDEKVTCRFWNDCISNLSCNEETMTVSFRYHESLGDYTHHFHSKQYNEVYHCLHMLIEQVTLSQIAV